MEKYNIYKLLYSLIMVFLQVLVLLIMYVALPENSQLVLQGILDIKYSRFLIPIGLLLTTFLFYLLFPVLFTWTNWFLFLMFKQKSTQILAHKLIHHCREEIVKENKVSDHFLSFYLHLFLNELLKKISKGFYVSLKYIINPEKSEIATIRCPDGQITRKEKKEYENEIKENPFIKNVFSDGAIVLVKNLKNNKLYINSIINNKLILREKIVGIIFNELIEVCCKDYNSICNFPVKTTLDHRMRSELKRNNPEINIGESGPHIVWAVLTIDHKLPFISYFIGKKLANIIGFTADLLFSTIFILNTQLKAGIYNEE